MGKRELSGIDHIVDDDDQDVLAVLRLGLSLIHILPKLFPPFYAKRRLLLGRQYAIFERNMSGRKVFSMGFLDRLFGGRAKTAEETRFSGEKMVVKAPMDGIVLPLEQLPDETFAAAILGPGCGKMCIRDRPCGYHGQEYAHWHGRILFRRTF